MPVSRSTRRVYAVDEAAAAGHDDAVLEMSLTSSAVCAPAPCVCSRVCPRRLHQRLRSSAEETFTVLGRPVTRSRPFTSSTRGLRAGYDAAYGHLQLLGGLFADQDVVAAADVADNGVVIGRAGCLYALALGYAAQGDHRRLRGAAAYVDYQVAVGLGGVQPGAVGPWRRRSQPGRPCAPLPR